MTPSSAHQIPASDQILEALKYVLRSKHRTIQELKSKIKGKFEEVLGSIENDITMRRIVFSHLAHGQLSRTDSEKMREFLRAKFWMQKEEILKSDRGEDPKFGSLDLEQLGSKVRHIHAGTWWNKDMTEAATTSIAFVEALIKNYGDPDEEDKKLVWWVKVKDRPYHKREKKEKWQTDDDDESPKINPIKKDDALNTDLVLSILESYLEALYVKKIEKVWRKF